MAHRLHMTQSFYHFLVEQSEGRLGLPITSRPSGYFFVELDEDQAQALINFLHANIDHWHEAPNLHSGRVRSAVRLLKDLNAYI